MGVTQANSAYLHPPYQLLSRSPGWRVVFSFQYTFPYFYSGLNRSTVQLLDFTRSPLRGQHWNFVFTSFPIQSWWLETQ